LKTLTGLVIGGILFLLGYSASAQMPTAADFKPTHSIQYKFDARKWTTGAKNEVFLGRIKQWVLPGESIDNWTEIVTEEAVNIPCSFTYSDKKFVLSEYVKHIQDKVGNGSDNFTTSILIETPDMIVFEWAHKGSGQWPAQREIRSVMVGRDGVVYHFAYNVKEASFSQTNYDNWKEIVLNAQLSNRRWK